jgi:3-hydroxybutyryl-CoA dehydrogenase
MNPIERIAVVGAGRMGRGIALSFAYAGLPVALIDLKPRPAAAAERLFAEARAEIAADLMLMQRLGLLDEAQADAVMALVSCVGREGAAAAVCAPLVFEGVPEVREAKRECLDFLGAHADADTIIASTTSTFLVTELAELVTHPARFLNAHWLNPAHLMPLVEISRGPLTGEDVVARLREVLERIGKVPVVCGPAPGYIVPRIQALAMNEAARMVEEGVASAEEIDKAVRTGFGLRFAVLGLLEFIDWGGGDILYYASRYLEPALGERYACPEIVARNMHEGRNGLRDGHGFYDYNGVDVAAYRERRLGEFSRMLAHLGLLPRAGAACPSPASGLQP